MAALNALPPTDDNFAAQLYTIKSKFDLAWASLALSGGSNFAELGALRSNFAALSIDKALHAAWHQELAAQRHKPVPLQGLFILGLGKLGGYDLNFSSDVDLIAFYEAQTLPISANKGQKYIVNKVLQRMGKLLKPNHSAEFVWRVDWRLRPESSSGGLSMTTEEASAFYFFRALPWHRLALMKARSVGGDMAAGDAFLNDISPFIWRQNLDFRALDELAHLKTRINLEHPGLQQERAQPDPIIPDPIGFNVKLGSGGIREIEFIANAQQLVWGGKQYELRTPNTLAALTALAELGHMDPDICAALSGHYIALRRLENAIQMLSNEQTHIVPDADYPLSQIASLLGRKDWADYADTLFPKRNFVNTTFAALFHAEDDSKDSTDVSLQNLSDRGQSIARSWLGGFNQHGIPRARLPRYQTLGRHLLIRVMDSTADADNALPRIDSFLKSLAHSEQYLHLLHRNPKLMDALISPLLHSPHMTRLLEQSPHIIDVFLDPQSVVNAGTAPDTEFVFTDTDYETRLERLRRFVNEYLFQYYHQFLRGKADLPQTQKHLTSLAEQTVDAAIKIACDDLEVSVPITVLGLGKMGTQRMAPMSDIDLIFIFGDDVESELAAKIVRRLRTVITTPLREGIAYDLDMRLRPSGRSGPPAVKLSSFEDHHMNRAKTWEHIALAHSRIVAGDRDLGAKVEAIRDRVLARPRDPQQFREDAALMWARIADQRAAQTDPDIINSKLRIGGLMQAEYLDACYRILDRPRDAMAKTIHFWSHAQIWERLLGLTQRPLSDIPPSFNATFLDGRDWKDYQAQVKDHEAIVIAAMAALLGDITLDDNAIEAPINWHAS